jgi:P4 family phage/plasmid primase-like protien
MPHPPEAYVRALSLYLATRHGQSIPQGAASINIRCFNPARHTNGDAHPSLRVELATGQWYCDPCGTGGGAVDLVKGIESCDAKRAHELLGLVDVDGGPGGPGKSKGRRSGARAAALSAPDRLRVTLERHRAALDSADPGAPAAAALNWLGESWHVTRATLDIYAVGLGPAAFPRPNVETFSLSCGSTDPKLSLSGIKLYRPRWKELGGDPGYKAIAERGSRPGLFGGHLLRSAAGRPVIVVGGEKDALIAAAALAPEFVVVASARGEGAWKAPTRVGADDTPRDLARAIVEANPASITLALDVNEHDHGTPHAAAAFSRAGAAADSVRAIAWPAEFAAEYPKGGVAQFLLDAHFGGASALSTLLSSAPPAPIPALSAAVSVDADDSTPQIRATDTGNARRLVARFGEKIRFVAQAGKWFIYDGARWLRDENGEISRLAARTVEAMFVEGAASHDPDERRDLLKNALYCESARGMRAMISQAEALLPAAPADFDRDPWLFNVQNGTVDLRTGALHEHAASDMITKIAPIPYDPDATCPAWEAFLARIFDNNADLIRFVQRAVGYSLTGSVREQVVFFLYGSGSNGKSTFLEILRTILGDYSQTANFSSFVERDNETVRNDLADLAGARAVTAMETRKDQRLDEAVIKQLTGGDEIKARFLFKEHFRYTPTFKIWLATNHRPVIRGGEHAIWRRIRLVPFLVTIPDAEQNQDMPSVLKMQISGVMTWCVKGCLDWQRNKLGTSDLVYQATEEYREEMDVLAVFKKEVILEVCDARVAATDLYRTFTEWCTANGETPYTQTTFGKKIAELGYKKIKSVGVKYWLGITIRVPGDGGTVGDSFLEGPRCARALTHTPEGVSGQLSPTVPPSPNPGTLPPESIPPRGTKPNPKDGIPSDLPQPKPPPSAPPPPTPGRRLF